ncbi:FIGNL1-interacting regulator of recombination and mitosis isoform X2 [Brachyhypopomus gauderio]|uniref:FIGNL1-interacting regulator of recombination and mitosis isoform X2 n=1 Tax=Brachyhypopomus gauderio TaxID=698409 RepID=UPI0040430B34
MDRSDFSPRSCLEMSQATLVEEVVGWSPETCRQELKVVLPKLVSVHEKTSSREENLNVLRIIVDMFLPHLPLSEVEDKCFSKVLPKVVEMFNSLLEELTKQIGGLSSQNTELQAFLRNILQMMVQTVEVLSACVRHVCSSEELLSLVSIRSLPPSVLHVLKETFLHCKESEVMYSGKLSLVGDLLQTLFKEAYSLQKLLMEVLEKSSLESSASEEEVVTIVMVIHSLLDMCSVISSLDIALHANTWKFIIKQSVKYQSLVEEHLRHNDITSALCEDLLVSVRGSMELAAQVQQETMHCPEYKLFQKTTKMCRFFTNTLVHYIKEFKPFLSKSCSHFYQIYLQILSKFPPSLSAPALPPALAQELSGAVLVSMDAMLSQLLSLRSFAECALAPAPTCGPLPLPHCLLLVTVLGKLSSLPEEALRLWCDGSQFSEETPRLSVFEATFLSFRQCRVERAVPVLLPGVMLHGQAQGDVSLHQHVCVHLCACIAALPAHHFPLLERALFASLLQSDTQTAVLASDVWCFLARFGTAEICFHHVLLTAHLIKSCRSEGYLKSHLGLLLRRLLFLMSSHHQLEFVERFTPSRSENLCVWRAALLRSLCLEARVCVEREVLSSATSALDAWGTAGYKLHSMDTLNEVLCCVLEVVRLDPLQPETEASTLKIIHQLWSRMSAGQVQAHPSLQGTLRVLLSVSAILIKNIKACTIAQAFSCLSGLDLHALPDDLLLAALEFLSSMGKVFIPSDIQSQVLPSIGGLFGVLLAHPSWLLRQHALEAFATFAEVTSHEEVISQSLVSEETKDKVVNFLSKTVAGLESREARVERLRTEAMLTERHSHTLERAAHTPVHTPQEPLPKRARQEPSSEEPSSEEYQRHLQAAESALRALQDMGTAAPPPPWVLARLQTLQTLIAHTSTGSAHSAHTSTGSSSCS